jgi:hypothetical protein
VAVSIVRRNAVLALLALCVGCEVKPAVESMNPATAASASFADVSAAVSAASAGDTVTVPAGQAVWSDPLVITKGISLVGAGIGQTVITSAYASSGGIFDASFFLITHAPSSPESNEAFRLSGFTIDLANACSGILVKNEMTSPLSRVRIDHLSIANPRDLLMHFYGTVFGVVDNNVLKSASVGVRVNGLDEKTWEDVPFEFGTADNIYFEDNAFSGADSLFFYGEMGGRYCVRFNTFDASASENGLYPFADLHGNQPNAHLAAIGAEIYGNVINGGRHGVILLDHRGGKALVYDNEVDNTAEGAWTKVREEFHDALNPPANHAVSGQPQHVSDSYSWGNMRNGATLFVGNPYIDGTVDYGGTTGLVPQENREFWREQGAFDGTTGVGVGVMASRPAAAREGVGYWATDVRILFRGTAAGAWEAYYVPFTYPHPLRVAEAAR